MSLSVPTICLNMIVKNESRIITRLLDSCSHVIDSYCIVDTGSTDNTVEIIEAYFREKGIPGRVFHEPFRDFGYNRTHALACAAEMDAAAAEFVLLLDADMILKLPIENMIEFKMALHKGDAHYIYQGNDRFYHKNVRVLKNGIGCKYWGVTHEYVKTPENTQYHQFGREFVFIDDRGDGGSKENKFRRDIELLTRALETTEPDNDRYYFYLGNSYYDTQQYEDAIRAYRKRIELGGWYEEVWYSYYRIGHCYKNTDRMELAIAAWMDAYQFFPNRIENLYEIVNYYRVQGKNQLAYMFYIFAKKAQLRASDSSPDYLFLHKDVYDYKLDYEMTVIGYYCNYDSLPLTTLCINVLNYPYLESYISNNVLSNYKFYTKSLYKECYDITSVFDDIGRGSDNYIDFDVFSPSTPSMALVTGPSGYTRFVVNRRFVNYRIDGEGNYINQERIVTKNVIALYDIILRSYEKTIQWRKTREFLMDYDTTKDNIYVGLEDVRLLSSGENDGKLYYSCNRGLSRNHILVETGEIDIATEKTDSRFLVLPTASPAAVEKNWVMFHDTNSATVKYIYGWYPLVIGNSLQKKDSKNHAFIKVCEYPTPPVFRLLRGSTNGCAVNNEIWFICHAVSYEERPRRVYYHMVVTLDARSYQLKRYTPFFTFEKSPVEYCLGLVYIPNTDEFIIGYSIMDRETKYMKIPRNELEIALSGGGGGGNKS